MYCCELYALTSTLGLCYQYNRIADTPHLVLMLKPYSFFELLDCSATNCHCPGLSLDHTARIAQDLNPLTKHLTTLSENKSGDTASYKPGDTARK